MAVISKQELYSRLEYFVVRTDRGNDLVRNNPRDLPRRLRVLLLAIDGMHTVQLYVNTLKGFGDISELLIELVALGLVRLRSPGEQQQEPMRSQQYHALDQLLDDSRFHPSTADVLYGTTSAGSFDEMLRVAQLESPEYQPPPPPAAPPSISPAAQKAQVESLFDLLEAVRGERSSLKNKVAKMNQLRAYAAGLEKNNQRLKRYLYVLSGLCALLLVATVTLAWCLR